MSWSVVLKKKSYLKFIKYGGTISHINLTTYINTLLYVFLHNTDNIYIYIYTPQLTNRLKSEKMAINPTRTRTETKKSEILELCVETLDSSRKRGHGDWMWDQNGRSRSLDEWRSSSSLAAGCLSGIKGEESSSRFIGDDEARLPIELECRSSAIARFGL